MSTETFNKHMNFRHVPVDGMSPYGPGGLGTDGGDHWVSVAYHNHLHRTHVKTYNHTHAEAS